MNMNFCANARQRFRVGSMLIVEHCIQVFDPTLKKKKKKKKTTFDLDAAFNEGVSMDDGTEMSGDKENQEPDAFTPAEDDDTLDLESFGRKKKKKKKAFNLDELDAALPDTKKEVDRPRESSNVGIGE